MLFALCIRIRFLLLRLFLVTHQFVQSYILGSSTFFSRAPAMVSNQVTRIIQFIVMKSEFYLGARDRDILRHQFERCLTGSGS